MNHKFYQQKRMINLLINILKTKKILIMMSYNIKLRMMNSKCQIEIFCKQVMTKMTTFLICKINKSKVKLFSKKRSKK